MPSKSTLLVRLVILFILLWFVMTLRLGAKFYGEQDSFRTWIPAAVRNYEIYDYDDIGLMIVRNGYVEEVGKLAIYSHHPPLLVWSPALFSKVAGQNEVSIRFVFAAAMLIACAALYTMVKRLYDSRVAFWAVLFFGMTPFIAYFETSYGHDPLGIMGFMLFGAVFVYWIKRPTHFQFSLLVLTALLAAWSAWPAIIFVGMISIWGLFFGTAYHRIGIIILGIVVVLSVLIMLVLYEYWWSGSIQSLFEAYIFRTSSASFARGSEPFTLVGWIHKNSMEVITFATLALVVLAIIGSVLLVRKGTIHANTFTLALLVSALIYFAVFRNATYIHHYYKAFIVPALAIGGAATVVYGRKLQRRYTRPIVDGLVLVFIVQSLIILIPLVNTTHEPSLTHIIDYINSQNELSDTIIVTFPGVNPGSKNAIEYYTMRPIQWNRRFDRIPQTQETLYILCQEDQQYVHDFYEGLEFEFEILDDTCTAYHLFAD